MTLRPAAPVAVLALLISLVACGGGDDDADTVPDVDRVAAAVQTRDSAALLGLIGYEQVACTTARPDVGGPPPCRAGEEDGALVDVVQAAQCEGAYLRPGDVENALQYFLDPRPVVYAAFEAPEMWESGEYAVVLTSSQQGRAVASQLVIEGGKIVLLDFGCGETPEEKIADVDQGSFLIEPAEPSATPEAT
jgi:hypothetical protein